MMETTDHHQRFRDTITTTIHRDSSSSSSNNIVVSSPLYNTKNTNHIKGPNARTTNVWDRPTEPTFWARYDNMMMMMRWASSKSGHLKDEKDDNEEVDYFDTDKDDDGSEESDEDDDNDGDAENDENDSDFSDDSGSDESDFSDDESDFSDDESDFSEDESDFSEDESDLSDDESYTGGGGPTGSPTRTLPANKDNNNSNKNKNNNKRPQMPENMTRRQFEDMYHLNRALSKPSFTPLEQQKWARKVKKRAWNLRPFEIHPSPPYELDALQNIHNRSFECNVLLEIRDVRLPASSHHPSFTRLAQHRLHLICYTHADMIDPPTRDRVEDWTKRSWPDSRSIFVDTREHRPDLSYDLLYDSLLGYLETRGGINSALTVGVPNTGKSCVLLALLRTARSRGDVSKKLQATVSHHNKKRRLGKSAPVGILDTPGKTRVITEYLLRESPRTFFLDVPGITPPGFYFEERPESWFAYGAANLLPQSRSMKDNVQIQTAFCDYVLHCLNRDSQFQYIPRLGLSGPTDDVEEVLAACKYARGENYDPEALQLKRCANFLGFLNTGNLGPVILDDISQPYKKFVFKDIHFVKQREKMQSLREERQQRWSGGVGIGSGRGDRGGSERGGGGGGRGGRGGFERGGGGRGRGGRGGFERGGGERGRGGRGGYERGGGGDGGSGRGGSGRDDSDKPLNDFDPDDFQF